MVDFLLEMWSSITTSDILELWPGGLIAGATWERSLVSNEPLRHLLEAQIGGKHIERHFIVGTADANNAEYVVYDYPPSDEIPDDIIDTLIASAAIDGVFPPVLRDGRTLVDGGSIWNANIISAVEKCRDMGFEDKDIIIDYILCSGSEIGGADTSDYHTLKHIVHAWNIRSYYSSMGDVERTKIFYPDVQFRYTLAPSEKISTSPIPLDFSPEHLQKCMEVGEKDALNAMKKGPGGYHEAMV